MKFKSWLKYFIYILLIIFITFLVQPIMISARVNAQATGNPYYTNVVTLIFYIVLGLILGLEHLFYENKKEGIWAFNLPKIVLMGLPSLYFSLAHFCIFYIDNQFLQNTLLYPEGILLRGSTIFIPAFQLILGYSIITSFYKKV